jgi:hypothetical protein
MSTVFGRKFGGIVDLETGPDGYLYVLSLVADEGKIYRILPKNTKEYYYFYYVHCNKMILHFLKLEFC